MKLNRVDFNKIAVFCQVIDSGNYQRASEALNVTPSALSQSVTSLEYSIGFKLFDRHGKKLVPTERGLRLHREFRAHQLSLQKTLSDLTGEKGKVSGLLRIGAYLEFAKSQLAPLMKQFTAEFPEAQIKIVFDTPSRLQELLQKGQLDLCFSIFPAREAKAIRSERVYQEELVVVASKGLLPEEPSFSDMMSSPIIEYYFNHQPMTRWLQLHFQRRPRKLPVRIYASTAEMVLALVREGAGVGVVPYYLFTAVEGKRDLRVIRPTQRKLTDHIWMLEQEGEDGSAIRSTFKRRLMERLPKSHTRR